MKCTIHGVDVNAKTVENLGWTEHGYAKAVMHEGKEYIVIKEGHCWRTLDFSEKIRISTNKKGLSL